MEGLRAYRSGDLEALIQLLRLHSEEDIRRFIGPWEASERMLREALPDAADRVWVLEERGRLLGFLWTEARGQVLWVEELHLIADVRGRGLGRGLLREAERLARQGGQRELRLAVFEHRPARAFYEHLGFQRVEDRPERAQVILRRAVPVG